MKAAAYWRKAGGGAVECELCPHRCRVAEGRRGRCGARANRGGTMVAETWGRPAALCVDPVEKKPLHHFLPGSEILSVGTLGCNLSCRFCQNWSLSHPEDGQFGAGRDVAPEKIAQAALDAGVPSVAATYNEPIVWAEYAMDVADACRAKGLRMAAVTAGYVEAVPRAEFFGKMDAANVDLKSIREEYYRKLCGARLGPVLETLEHVSKSTGCWLEVTTLLVPGQNDSDGELDELTAWVAEHLGPETPLHFSAFHPDGEMMDLPPTPVGRLARARELALGNGLRHVYAGNVRGMPDWTATFCAGCGARLIEREGYKVRLEGIDGEGTCVGCGRICKGAWK